MWFGTLFKPTLLEIRIPKEIPKPIRAMEMVFTTLHGAIYNDPDWWEKYVSGEPQTSFSFEIASIDGQIHFYIRAHGDYREQIEAAIYSQFPDVEIEAVADYTKQIPMDIPNRDWDLFGWDWKMLKPANFPIPTYESFEEENKNAEEEEKIDFFTSLMEGMAKLKPGEQMWIQIRARPIYYTSPDGAKFVKDGQHLRDVLAKRIDEKKANLTPLWKELIDFIMHGASAAEEKPQELFPAEMRLTAAERETVEAVEKKYSKPIFACTIRNIYLGKRDVWFKQNYRYFYNYFNHFTNPNINSLWVWSKTLTRVKKSPFWFVNYVQDRRAYVKRRRMLRVYRDRLNYYSPWDRGDEAAKVILNVEELATLYHFPSHGVSPTPGITRTEAKETVAPHNLPI